MKCSSCKKDIEGDCFHARGGGCICYSCLDVMGEMIKAKKEADSAEKLNVRAAIQ
jgi:hypothetical protein